MKQLGFPSTVTQQEIAREQSLGGSIDLCVKAAGLTPKEIQSKLELDKAQFSRWADNKEGVLWPKFEALMDACGNDAPLFWMLMKRGYDLSSLRRAESETERKLRLAQEEVAQLKHDKRVLTEALHGRVP